jgi:predicted GH43/DUF377 family glycosyl hydrolase
MKKPCIRGLAFFLLALLVAEARAGTDHAWALGPFSRPAGVNPLIRPDTNAWFKCPMTGTEARWAALHTFNPAAVARNGRVYVFYRAEDASGAMQIGGHTSRIGLAESTDGQHFVCRPEPVLFPDADNQRTNEWTGGCEDPRVVETEAGELVMTYTEYCRNDTHAIARLGVATSRDLIHWTKHGPAFEKLGGDFAKHGCKSGAILTRLAHGRLVAARLMGKYWMYWGEGDIRLASSEDLLNWVPGPVVLPARQGKFDSALAEAGPPPVITDQGIVVLYNGKNAEQDGDPSISGGAYCGGQALFDLNHPEKLMARTDAPFYRPEADFERTGQYQAGTTFLEGLVFFKGRWLLYYGCADSYVAMAESEK